MASQKRETLLSCARNLFETQGFHTTGIDRILDEANVAKMTLYNNFGSKDQLIVAVLDQASTSMINNLQGAAAACSDDPYEQILGIFDTLAMLFSDPSFCGCMFQAAVAEFPDPNSLPSKAAREHHARLIGMFQSLCIQAEIPDPLTLAQMLTMITSGSLCTARQNRSSQPALQARQIAEILLERACSTGFRPTTAPQSE
jgi:AcrR family transcriptional regulator